VLLDEMLDRRLKRFLPAGIDALTVRERGWGSKSNGELLDLAQHEFDVLVTTDRGIPHQQDLSRFDLAVVILRARSNSYEDLAPLVGKASAALPTTRPGGTLLIDA
jgi:predicted nuclease of predicted toxin-antitoxin system